jgi:serine/threonine protein kinase
MVLENGSDFAGYRIARVLGKGGMGQVYLASRHDLPRDIALKVLLSAVADDAESSERFRLEARTTAQLRHPHIVTLYDFGIHLGQPWMALDFIDGGDLSQRLTYAPLAHSEGFKLLLSVADALDYAHSKGVIHRDLKPQNILLSRSGHAYLADFGIAKLQNSHSLHVKTATGSIVGSPSYMSPEQACGQVLTPASDQYALAVICFEWLTGSKPFTSDTPLAILMHHLQTPPPEAVLERLKPATAAVLRQGLAKAPADRFDSAHALVTALAESVSGSQGEAGKIDLQRQDFRAGREKSDSSERSSVTATATTTNAEAARSPLRRGLLSAIGLVIAVAVVFLSWQRTAKHAVPIDRPIDNPTLVAAQVHDAQPAKRLLGTTTEPAETTSTQGNSKASVPLRSELKPKTELELRMQSFISDSSKSGSERAWFTLDGIEFRTATATMRPESSGVISVLAALLREQPTLALEIGGFTDNVGNADSNQRLSSARATAVVQAIVALGVDAGRLTSQGYGNANPVGDNTTADGRQKNRRIAFRMVAQ